MVSVFSGRLKEDKAKFLVLILIMAFTLRSFGLWDRALGVDEGVTLAYGYSFEEAIGFSNSDFYPPLSYALFVPFLVLFGELGTRIVFAFLGTFAVYVFFLLAKKFFPEKEALLAAALFALNPFNVFYSVQLRQYLPLLVLFLLSFYFLLEFLKNNSWKNLAKFTVPAALMMYVHYIALFYIFPLGIFALWTQWKKRKLKKIGVAIIFLFVVFISLVPLALTQYSEFTGTNYSSENSSLDLTNLPYAFYKLSVGVNISSALEFFPLLILAAPLVLGLALFGLWLAFKEKKKWVCPLFSFIAIILLFVTAAFKAPFLLSYRYLYVGIPLFLLFVSNGLFYFKENKRLAIFAVLLFFWLLAIAYYYLVSPLPDWNALLGL